jgi:hypothetical protein
VFVYSVKVPLSDSRPLEKGRELMEHLSNAPEDAVKTATGIEPVLVTFDCRSEQLQEAEIAAKSVNATLGRRVVRRFGNTLGMGEVEGVSLELVADTSASDIRVLYRDAILPFVVGESTRFGLPPDLLLALSNDGTETVDE